MGLRGHPPDRMLTQLMAVEYAKRVDTGLVLAGVLDLAPSYGTLHCKYKALCMRLGAGERFIAGYWVAQEAVHTLHVSSDPMPQRHDISPSRFERVYKSFNGLKLMDSSRLPLPRLTLSYLLSHEVIPS